MNSPAELLTPADPRRGLPAGTHVDPDGSFTLEQYDFAPAFSSFLPGVAREHGAPLWCMIVNRGQAVAGFGVNDKDHPIQEFLSARWAYQLTALQGFRTFLQEDGAWWEALGRRGANAPRVLRRMRIDRHAVRLEEEDPERQLTVRTLVFSPVDRPLASLARRVEITNDAATPRSLRVVDGLAVLVPATTNDFVLKNMRRMGEAFMRARLEADLGAACFSPPATPGDTADVRPIEECTFAAMRRVVDGALEPIEPVVDPDVIFGPDADLVEPLALMAAGGVDRAAQVLCDRLPCAMACEEILLQPGETAAFIHIFGHAPRRDLLEAFLATFPDEDSLDDAEGEARALVDHLTAPALTVSSVPALDAYARQNFLDNVLRGGIPSLLPSADGPRPVWLHTRRHGDMERDYNFFSVPARPFSEGAGNFRDVCQNRRHNAWFHPESAEADLRLFCELIQADGYNPLSVEGWRWRAPEGLDLHALFPGVHGEAMDQLGGILHRAFAPGELAQWIQWNLPAEDALARTRQILALCPAHISAHGHEGGYWVDHWIYLVDLVESLRGLCPDTVAKTLAGTLCGWWDEGVDVLPRAQRAQRVDDRWVQSQALRPAQKKVALPPTSLLGKLATLAVLRAHTLDPEGRGVEMEAGRPGWNDAMNGLPGVFASSTRETGAVRDLCALLLEILPAGAECDLPAPAAALLREAPALLDASRPYPYHAAADRREAYRAALRADDAARSERLPAAALKAALQAAEAVTRRGLEASVDPATGLAHLYFARDTAIAPATNGASATADAAAMTVRPLPLFLEAQVALLRARHSADAARASRAAVHKSPLLDDVLRMYKLNESLASQPYSIGRARTFSPGWYENESIWTHMSYKYLVELLRSGAAAEFHDDARTMLVPFMDPATYGRSTLENSSFIASSACPDEKAWGRGFIARLSGSTAEFIHLWVLMTSGERPFTVGEDGQLELRLAPALPGEWFTREARDVDFLGRAENVPADSLAFAFLNRALVVYHNAARRDTFGERPARPAAIRVDGALVARDGVLRGDHARRVREGLARRLDIVLE